MNRKPILNSVALGVVAIVFLVAGIALAQGPGQGMGKCGNKGKFGHGGRGAGQNINCVEDGGFDRIDRMALRLDLSDDQKVAIKELHDANRAENVSLRKDMMKLRNEMQAEMMQDDPSEKTVLGISAKMNAVKGELQANRLKTRLAVRKELTSEQRDQMLLMGGPGKGNGKGHGSKGGFKGKGGPGCGQSGHGFHNNRR